MEIYILRHGIAEDPRPGLRDSDRALTGEGKKKLREVLEFAREAGVKPELLLTSPFRRARETAEIAHEILAPQALVAPCNSIIPGGEMGHAWTDIRTHKDAEAILLATHEPFAGLFTAYLLNVPVLPIDVKKGAMIRVDVEAFGPQPHGVLKWMLTPRLAGAR